MAVIIVLTNQKGGVGKTTSSAALAGGLVQKGFRVLAIDMDPQGNLGFSLGLGQEEGDIYEVLSGAKGIREAICKTEECDVIPSGMMLSSMQTNMDAAHMQTVLKEKLKEVENDYDYIVIDTPPALNLLTVNAYAAASYLIIPMGADILSLVGLAQLRETVEAVRNQINPQLKVLGILLTRFNARTRLSKDVLDMAGQVAGQLDTKVFSNKIRTAVAVSEAPAHGESIIKYAKGTKVSKDYEGFVAEVLDELQAGREA